MRKRIIIPYEENKDTAILIALGAIKDYSDMKFEQIGALRDSFHNKKDIYCDITSENFDELLYVLKARGLTFKVTEIPS